MTQFLLCSVCNELEDSCKCKTFEDRRLHIKVGDVLRIKFSKDVSDVLHFEKMPLVKAIHLAADLAADNKLRRIAGNKVTTTKGALQIETDINNICTAFAPDGSRRPIMDLLNVIVHRKKDAERIRQKFGRLLCINRIRNAGTKKNETCTQSATHKTYPQIIFLTKPAVLYVKDGKHVLTKPQWRWFDQATINSKRLAEDETIPELKSEFRRQFEERARAQERSKHNFGKEEAIHETVDGLSTLGLCNPCWMQHFEIIPREVLLDMLYDLDDIRSISHKYLGGVRTKEELKKKTIGYESRSVKPTKETNLAELLGKDEEELSDGDYVISYSNPSGEIVHVENAKILDVRGTELVDPIDNAVKNWINNKARSGDDFRDNIEYRDAREEEGGGNTTYIITVYLGGGFNDRWTEELRQDLLDNLRNLEGGQDITIRIVDADVSGHKRIEAIIHPIELGIIKVPGEYDIYDVENQSNTTIKEDDIINIEEIRHARIRQEQVAGTLSEFQTKEGMPIIGQKITKDGEPFIKTVEYITKEGEEIARYIPYDQIDGEGEPFDDRRVKSLILEQLGVWYQTYLSDLSFFPLIADYVDKRDGIPETLRNKLKSRLEYWRDELQKTLDGLTEYDGKYTLINAGIDDGTLFGEDLGVSKDKISYLPWYTKCIIRLMDLISHMIMWTSMLRYRYVNRNAFESSEAFSEESIRSMMSLERKDRRNAIAYANAIKSPEPGPIGRSRYTHLNKMARPRSESANVDPNKILIYGVDDDTFLNGLTGIIEAKTDEGRYIVRLDDNNVVVEGKVVVERSEFAYFCYDPENIAKTPSVKNIKPIPKMNKDYENLMLESVYEDDNKSDIIGLIGEFTPEYPDWS